MTQTDKAPSKLEQADIAATENLKPLLEREPAKAVGKLGKLADEPPLLVLSSLVLVAGLLTRRPRLQRTAVRMLAAHGVAIGFKTVVKDRVDRTRPKLLDEGKYRMEPGTSSAKELRSFPSGHAAGSAAVARAAAREYPIGPAATATAGALAVLQVVRRAHFPSDIVAGAALGLAAEAVADRLLRLVLPRARKRDRTPRR